MRNIRMERVKAAQGSGLLNITIAIDPLGKRTFRHQFILIT